MGRTIDQLLDECDQIIEKRGSARPKPVVAKDDDQEVTKLAEALMSDEPIVPASSLKKKASPQPEVSLAEKVAGALAITEVLMNVDHYRKIHAFEKAAAAKGFSQEQIDKFVTEKFGSVASGAKGLAKSLTAPGALLGLAGAGAGAAGGYTVGKKKGKEKGYTEALEDVNNAFSQYAQG